jgi:hypothetical protein
MKSCSLICMLWIVIATVKGQTIHPGGVKGAMIWYSTDVSVVPPVLRNQLPGDGPVLGFDKATAIALNFHPSLVFSGIHPLRVHLGNHDLRHASYFTVYQSLDTAAENTIWHITNDRHTTLVLTTDRMADLSAFRYMNYYDVVRAQPKVNVYVQHKEKDTVSSTDQWWNIGVKPAAPQLPVMNFKGLIPEIIAYDRVLNSMERLQVASYLALKYGITLTEPRATYMNSAGSTIWDGYDHPAWHRNIAGICRDDVAGLDQSIASSSNLPGLLTILTRDSLYNNHFLLWGDNGKPLTTAPRIAGMPLLLQKTWLMKSHGNLSPFTTDLLLDTKQFDVPLPNHPVYWLAIDPTGKGQFNAEAIEFIKMDKLDQQGKALFKNVTWDRDGSGKDVWGIIVAQDLLLATVIHQPNCKSPGTGSMQVKIVGGRAPFQLIIQNNNGFFRKIDQATSPTQIANLDAGKYFLSVTDAAQHRYTDSFYINHEDVPLPVNIASGYTLPANKSLQLNAGQNMPADLSWEWNGPANFQSFHAQVTITEPGLYTVRCSKDECSTTQDILVKAAHSNILYNVTVFPNTSSGAFTARIALDKPAPVTMAVYNSEGKLISTQKADHRTNYQFKGELKVGGMYELVFTSGLSQTNKRLVIVK